MEQRKLVQWMHSEVIAAVQWNYKWLQYCQQKGWIFKDENDGSAKFSNFLF